MIDLDGLQGGLLKLLQHLGIRRTARRQHFDRDRAIDRVNGQVRTGHRSRIQLILQAILIQHQLIRLSAGQDLGHKLGEIAIEHEPFLELLDVIDASPAGPKPASPHGLIMAGRHQLVLLDQFAQFFNRFRLRHE